MKEIRLHGRFGQPVGELVKKIATYALEKGYHVQAYNSFAAVRPGAPTFGVVKIDQEKILERSTPEANADVVVVLDNSLFAAGNVLKGLKKPGVVMALGVEADVVRDHEGAEFRKLDAYFKDNPSDIGGNIINALKELTVLN
jgi:pyruvate ferredoxin oxidoreductase gamma subunit